MKRVALLVALWGLVAACSHSGDPLIGTWQAVSMDNPEQDSNFVKSRIYVDTAGRNNTAAENRALYGVTNMDSMRRAVLAKLDSAKAMQDEMVRNTVYTFRRDSVVIITFGGATDSSRWSISTDGYLILDDLEHPGTGDALKTEIGQLSDTVLKLKFADNNTVTTVTFRKKR